jgi:hypothetical protein
MPLKKEREGEMYRVAQRSYWTGSNLLRHAYTHTHTAEATHSSKAIILRRITVLQGFPTVLSKGLLLYPLYKYYRCCFLSPLRSQLHFCGLLTLLCTNISLS